MSEQPSSLEARVAELTEALRLLERRVVSLERGRAAAGAPRTAGRAAPAAARAAPAEPEVLPGAAELTRGLSLGGRTLLVLAGAFVLRALTDSGTLPGWLGAGLGFLYAGTWIAMADRAGRAGQAWSAGFHGLAAVAVGFPLLFEAAARFKLLSPVGAAAFLTLLSVVALAVAARRSLQALAWLVAAGGLVTSVALMVVSGRLAPAAIYLVLLGTAALWLGYVKDWMALRWPVALVTDLVVAILAARALAPAADEGPGAALLVQALLLGAYLGSIATRTLLLDRSVVVFEVVQTSLAILVGLGGAVYVAGRSGMGRAGFGLVSVAFGLAAYAVAFTFAARLQSRRANFYFYSSVAVVFVLAGAALLLPEAALPVACAALALVSGLLARRRKSRTLAAHAALYALLGATSGDVLGHALEAVTAGPGTAWTPLPWGSLLLVAALAATAWLTSTSPARIRTPERLAQLTLVAALAAGVAGLLIGWLAPIVAGTPGEGPGASPGALAALRSCVLSAGAVLLAWLGRRAPWHEAGWLAYPLLGALGVKILAEDLPRSRPATLVLTFALYGAALILVPRLRHRRPDAAQGPPARAAESPAAAAAPAGEPRPAAATSREAR